MLKNPKLGFVATIAGFDPLRKEGGEYAYLQLARQMSGRTTLFTRFSMPMKPQDEFVELARRINADTGYEIVPIVLVDAAKNPADPAAEDAAIANLKLCFDLAIECGAKQTMGPTGEPWSPAAPDWGKSDPPKLPGKVLADRIKQAAKVHVAALEHLAPGVDFTHNVEYLFPGEQRTFNTPGPAVSLARAVNKKLGRTRLMVAHDSAHRYEDRAYSADELRPMFAEDAKLHAAGEIGLLHFSRPRERCHPLTGGYPARAHFRAQFAAGYQGAVDIEMFSPEPFLFELLPEFTGRDRGFEMSDVFTPHIDAATKLLEWLHE